HKSSKYLKLYSKIFIPFFFLIKMIKIACLLVLCMVVLVAPDAQATLTCTDVNSYLIDCKPFLTLTGYLGSCCDSIKKLNDAATTIDDQQIACDCLREYSTITTDFNWVRVSSLPLVCHVRLPYLVKAKFDCSSVRKYDEDESNYTS
ncbi:hypothetical protein AABB24_015414, partial [Solanum stoloniferum]